MESFQNVVRERGHAGGDGLLLRDTLDTLSSELDDNRILFDLFGSEDLHEEIEEIALLFDTTDLLTLHFFSSSSRRICSSRSSVESVSSGDSTSSSLRMDSRLFLPMFSPASTDARLVAHMY